MTFPQRLMKVLADEEHSDTITWLPHGRSFFILKRKKFVADVLPRYFRQSKFTSFTRKLKRWGFTRVTQRGPETGAYFHEFFQRRQPNLCLQMCCQNSAKPWIQPSMLASSLPMIAPPVSFCYARPSVATEVLASRQMLRQQQMQLRLEQQVATNKALYLHVLQSRRDNYMLGQQVAFNARTHAKPLLQRRPDLQASGSSSNMSEIRRATAA